MKPEELPIYEHKELINNAIKKNRVVVIESPTGSGKTTQLPKIMFDSGLAGEGGIGVTQPRRIAAVSVSHFLAKQYRSPIPGLVGYKMRFVDETSPHTSIVIMTDGILLQELKTDSDLSQYSIIMVDEAHERSLNIDFILGLLKSILKRREDLRIIISSATINARVFSEYFDGCPVVSVDAKMYPVEIIYDKPEEPHGFENVLNKIIEIVNRINKRKEHGDILIFLSGEGQIKECISALEELNRNHSMIILPLYSRLSQEEQERVFEDFSGKRKVIVATNIAETSVTIDGVRHVIDPGFAKINYYNPSNFTSSLVEMPISRASCNQRRGRAGRTAPGKCYRLYTEEDYLSRPLFTEEEIYRTDLSEVVLRMAELGIKEFEEFDFISNPGTRNIHSAVEALKLLEAIDNQRELTVTGRMMVKFPIIPRLSRMIVASIMEYPDVLEEVLIASAFLNGKSPFLLPHGFELEARKAHHFFRHKLGDFISYIKIYNAYIKSKNKQQFCNQYYLDYKCMEEIYNVKKQLTEIVSQQSIPVLGGGGLYNYLCAVSKGLIQFVCKRTGGATYRSLTAYGIKIHPGSVMYREKPEYIVAGEIFRTSKLYATSVSPLTPSMLKKISPDLLEALSGKKIERVKEAVRNRDYTNFIKIGNETFEIRWINKKKKQVLLPLEKLKKVLMQIDPQTIRNYKGLRGTVLLENGYEILSGINLRRILEIVPKLHGQLDVVEKWSKGVQFEYIRDAYEIVRYIPELLKPCKKTKGTKKLCFLTLITNGDGYYWFACYKDFIQALEESISSLESVIDEDIKMLSNDQEKVVNETYRRLVDMLEG